MNEKRLEPEKITALYERLSRDDEQIGDSMNCSPSSRQRNKIEMWLSL